MYPFHLYSSSFFVQIHFFKANRSYLSYYLIKLCFKRYLIMFKLLLMATSIFWGCTLISYTASADAPSNNTTNNDSGNSFTNVTKDEWLKSVIPMLPNLICKGFEKDPELQKRFADIKMNYE